MHEMMPLLRTTEFPQIVRSDISTLQVNLGYLCNQSCVHCHVNAGPTRTEMMSLETINEVVAVIKKRSITTLDLTGGAPELNPHFRTLVTQARALDCHVIDRCNLSVLFEEGQQGLAEFLAQHQVEVVASLPCYTGENVDSQRGKGVFNSSIEGLRKLNLLGYGCEDSSLALSLVYNPLGPHLPPEQSALEKDYRRELGHLGITFTRLLTITNMPIARFGSTLVSRGQFDDYMALLKQSFNNENLEHLMCRKLVSVDYRGHLYDCDFNQMLRIPSQSQGAPLLLKDLLMEDTDTRNIGIADHCYGCTAGSGSSCGGSLS